MQNSRVNRKILGMLIVLGWLGALLTIIGEFGSQSLAQPVSSPQQPYKVEFATPGSENLPDQAKTAIVDATSAWRGAKPPNNTFLLVNVEWHDDWAIGTLTTASAKPSPTPSMDSTTVDNIRVTPDNMIAFILVQTPNGWQAALDVDPNAQYLLSLIPDSELSSESKQVIFPLNQQVRVQNQVQQQYSNYKLPWRAGETWYRATGYDQAGCPGGWHNVNGNCGGNALDFYSPNANAEILAAASGTVTKVCKNSEQTYIIIQTENTSESLIYVHIKASSLTVNQGQKVTQGQYLGRMASASNQSCGWGTFVHLHLQFPTKPFTIDGYTFSATNTHKGVALKSTNGSAASAPADKNLITNGNFNDSNANGWSKWGDVSWGINKGEFSLNQPSLAIRHIKGGSGVGASIYQSMNYKVADGKTLEVVAEFGNTSNVDKIVTLAMRSTANWDNSYSCKFTIPAKTPLQKYVMRSKAKNWSGIQLEIHPAPADSIPEIIMDNVAVIYRPQLTIAGKECHAPSSTLTWNFQPAYGLQGWIPWKDVRNPRQLEGGMWVQVSGNDPYIYGPSMLNILAEDYPVVFVSMQSQSSSCGQVYFRREGDAGFISGQGVGFTIKDDGKAHGYYINMASDSAWVGKITQLRLDPGGCASGYDASRDNGVAIVKIALLPDQLVNGGFEEAANDEQLAKGWQVKGKTAGDKRICGDSDKSLAGQCAFQFNVNNTPTTLARKITPVGTADDNLALLASVKGKNVSKAGAITANIVYMNGEKAKIKLSIPKGTYEYRNLTGSFTLSRKVKKITVAIRQNAGTGGTIWVDEVRLVLNGNTSAGLNATISLPDAPRDNLIPLPAAPKDLRSN